MGNLEISMQFEMPKAPISSNRFFFSPTSTKSLMEDLRSSSSFLRTSVMIAMASRDPYRDFKESMEEMVEAFGIRKMPRLQELLHCYLKLNEMKNHKIIKLAFVDLVLDLIAQERIALA